MALVGKDRSDPRVELAAQALAGGVPFACWIATLSLHDYWLDSSEFVAEGVELGIAHPPGHPLEGLVANLVSLVPLGPLSLRVSLASALCATVAAVFLYRAIDTTLRVTGTMGDAVRIPLALGATWLAACAPGFWLSAIRPEVYALHAMLGIIAIERVVALEARWPTSDVRPAYVGALAVGLALANHHYLAILLLPAFAPTLARIYRARGPRGFGICIGMIAAGLSTYVYLPLRAHAHAALALGDPQTPENFWWVISAKVYNKQLPGSEHVPMFDRFMIVIIRFVENVHVVPALMAVAGAYALLRMPGARRIGWVWTAVLVVMIAGRTYNGPIGHDPDAIGYLMAGYGAIAALAAALVGVVLSYARGAANRVAFLVALGLAALGLAQARESAQKVSLVRFHAPDDFDDVRIRDLPEASVVIVHTPATAFRAWGVDAVERLRPDIVYVPMPFLGYPGVVDALTQRSPDLVPLIRGYLLDGVLRESDLQSLAATRPLFIEMDPRVPLSLVPTLVPAPGFHQVLPDGTTEADERVGARARRASLAIVEARVADDRDEPGTRDELLWTAYTDALYYAAFGDRDAARESVHEGLAHVPEAHELRALGEALRDPSVHGPLDVHAFFPDAPAP